MCSEASIAVGEGASGTFARQSLVIAAHCNETFVPREMELKEWQITRDVAAKAQRWTRSPFHVDHKNRTMEINFVSMT